MKMIGTIFAVIALDVLAACAGVIHGTITLGGAPLRNATVSIAAASQPAVAAQTNDQGRYSVNVKPQGRCTLSIAHDGRNLQHEVFSYADPAQYDFEIVADGKGGWMLRRK